MAQSMRPSTRVSSRGPRHSPPFILGVSCFFHDAAACLMQGGRVVAAAQEERFSRRKNDPEFPLQAIEYCLSEAGIGVDDIHCVGFYEKPLLRFLRLLRTYIDNFPRGFPSYRKAMGLWLKQKRWIPRFLRRELGYDGEIYYIDHHLSHAASAFYFSPFERAAILTVDGVGEWATTTLGTGEGHEVRVDREIHFPHSLGLLYSAFTQYLGFEVNEGEYKVMGLAPYGQPRYARELDEVIQVDGSGIFSLNRRYFSFEYELEMINRKFETLFGLSRRKPETPLLPAHRNIAASVQKKLEEALLHLAQRAHALAGFSDLVLAGGVALNCVANSRILREGPFQRIFVQPAAGDAGGAMGVAAFLAHGLDSKCPREPLRHVYLGPGFETFEIKSFLSQEGCPFQEYEEPKLLEETARLLAEGKVVGWFQGRMEWGPRALGNRSILADPRREDMKDILNQKVKWREPFRPFAPAIVLEEGPAYFEMDGASPFMLFTYPVKRPQDIPAVTHVDGSSRVQTVAEEENPRFYKLLKAFQHVAGVPVLINTSFNLRGEPIVCTPVEAYDSFMKTDIDVLVLDRFIIKKREDL